MVQNIIARNNVKLSGKGKQTLVFGHGFGCDQSFWRFVAPAFEDDFKVVLFDYVGSGKSDITAYQAERYNTLGGYALDVMEICRELDLKDAIFIGHSVSSMVGLNAVVTQPGLFKKLIMIGASPCYVNYPPDYMGGYEKSDLLGLIDMIEKNYLGWANYLAPIAMKNADRPELARELEDSFKDTHQFIMHDFAIATFLADFRHLLPKIEIPALIMHTSDDVFVPPSVAEYMKNTIPGSLLALMKAYGHFPHLSHPEETIKIIKDFVSPVKTP